MASTQDARGPTGAAARRGLAGVAARRGLAGATARTGLVGAAARRGLALGVLLLFTAGLLGEAYALHECDHHHLRSVTAAPHQAHGPDVDLPPGHSSEQGPCCCPDGFHSGPVALLPVTGPSTRAAPPSVRTLRPGDRGAERGFRALPGEFLPPPNAPPLL